MVTRPQLDPDFRCCREKCRNALHVNWNCKDLSPKMPAVMPQRELNLRFKWSDWIWWGLSDPQAHLPWSGVVERCPARWRLLIYRFSCLVVEPKLGSVGITIGNSGLQPLHFWNPLIPSRQGSSNPRFFAGSHKAGCWSRYIHPGKIGVSKGCNQQHLIRPVHFFEWSLAPSGEVIGKSHMEPVKVLDGWPSLTFPSHHGPVTGSIILTEVVLLNWRMASEWPTVRSGGFAQVLPSHMGMDQYLLIPFLGGWTSIYQLFWCSPGVLLVLTHCHILETHSCNRCFLVDQVVGIQHQDSTGAGGPQWCLLVYKNPTEYIKTLVKYVWKKIWILESLECRTTINPSEIC